MRILSILLLASLAASCGPSSGAESISADAPQRVEARAPMGAKLVTGERLFSAPELDSLRRAGARVATIVAEPTTIGLRPGERYRLDNIAVTARDARGALVPDAPMTIELASEGIRLDGTTLMVLHGCAGKLVIRSLLPGNDGSYAKATIALIAAR